VIKFFSALAILLFAIFLQLFFASVGWYFNLSLAVLIAFAFALNDLWELLVADLLAVFILNWQPAPSGTLILFALIPLAAFAFRKLVRTERWIGTLTTIFFGFLTFYLLVAPAPLSYFIVPFLEDVMVAFLVGELIVFAV
jgi:hypothetical protein